MTAVSAPEIPGRSFLVESAMSALELRFCSGLEVSEVAELLGVSEPTIKRGTRAAKAFLEKEIAAG